MTNSPPHLQDQNEMKKIQKEIMELWKQEEKFWGQRSRLKWLKWGDRNSKFFHATTVQRRNRNRIIKIKNDSGDWVEGTKEILTSVEEYYRALFTSVGPRDMTQSVNAIPKRVSAQCNNAIEDEPSEMEIKEAIDSLGELKAPGPDGLNGLFYKQHWTTIKEEVCSAIQAFFMQGILPEFINETQVALIPKVDKPESINQLRPISCCNFLYKVITKILVTRLKLYLNSLVSQAQSAFIGGRQIQDNILVAHEIFHALKGGRSQAKDTMAIKLDKNKAYDRMEWDNLQVFLEAHGFNEKWINRLMVCVRGANYRFKVNEELSGRIFPGRGLRQGDPLPIPLRASC